MQTFICYPDHFVGLAYPTMVLICSRMATFSIAISLTFLCFRPQENSADDGRASAEQLRGWVSSLQLSLLKHTNAPSLKAPAVRLLRSV